MYKDEICITIKAHSKERAWGYIGGNFCGLLKLSCTGINYILRNENVNYNSMATSKKIIFKILK